MHARLVKGAAMVCEPADPLDMSAPAVPVGKGSVESSVRLDRGTAKGLGKVVNKYGAIEAGKQHLAKLEAYVKANLLGNCSR